MKLLMNSLCLIVCTVFSVVTYAAIEETEIVQQSGMNSSHQSESSSKETEKNEKDLTNEPKPRGQLLYENQCHFCHESTVHIREGHKAKKYSDIQYWVGRWADELDTKWSADEIDAVVQYLNDTFYHY